MCVCVRARVCMCVCMSVCVCVCLCACVCQHEPLGSRSGSPRVQPEARGSRCCGSLALTWAPARRPPPSSRHPKRWRDAPGPAMPRPAEPDAGRSARRPGTAPRSQLGGRGSHSGRERSAAGAAGPEPPAGDARAGLRRPRLGSGPSCPSAARGSVWSSRASGPRPRLHSRPRWSRAAPGGEGGLRAPCWRGGEAFALLPVTASRRPEHPRARVQSAAATRSSHPPCYPPLCPGPNARSLGAPSAPPWGGDPTFPTV